jgi:hypothetical protein
MKGLSPDSRYKRLKRQCAFAFFVTAFMATFGFSKDIKAVEKALPFSPGEKLTIQVKWGFITAGEAILEVFPVEVVNGVKSHHFVLLVKTSKFVDFFYKVRERIDSYADTNMTHSILYKKQKQGKRRKDVVVDFNWEKNEAQYSNLGKKKNPISILPGSFDPLSVFYAFRLHDLKVNTEIERAVTDGKKCVMGKAKVLRREKIKVADRTYDTYLVEPDLEHLEGVFEKSNSAELKIWVTADELRIPVRIKSKVIVGSFVAELISVEKTGQNCDTLKQ